MKPYIMQYSEKVLKQSIPLSAFDSTTKTFSVESDENDTILMGQWTTMTKVSESSDEDSIFIPLSSTNATMELDRKNICMDTMFTESTENNDDDYIVLSTIITNVTENQDDDFIFLS